MVSEDFVRRINEHIERPNWKLDETDHTEIYTMTNEKAPIIGKFKFCLNPIPSSKTIQPGEALNCDFYVMKHQTHPIILGMDFIQEYNISISFIGKNMKVHMNWPEKLELVSFFSAEVFCGEDYSYTVEDIRPKRLITKTIFLPKGLMILPKERILITSPVFRSVVVYPCMSDVVYHEDKEQYSVQVSVINLSQQYLCFSETYVRFEIIKDNEHYKIRES